MIAIFLVGLYGLIEGIQHLLFVWLLLPIFSPRFVGEINYALGKILGGPR